MLDISGYFRIWAVFEQHGISEPQVLTYYGNDLEVIGLDGRGDRLIPTDGPCAGYYEVDAAVSPDGLWAVCVFRPYPSTIVTPFLPRSRVAASPWATRTPCLRSGRRADPVTGLVTQRSLCGVGVGNNANLRTVLTAVEEAIFLTIRTDAPRIVRNFVLQKMT